MEGATNIALGEQKDIAEEEARAWSSRLENEDDPVAQAALRNTYTLADGVHMLVCSRGVRECSLSHLPSRATLWPPRR
jgi:hypothetical protein